MPSSALYCRNVHCSDYQHRTDLDTVAEDVMEAISTSVRVNIPHSKPGRRRNIPGWSDEVAPYKDAAYFWWSVWKSAGKPQNTQLHMVMKSTRNKYTYVLRRVKKQADEIRKSKFVQDCLEGRITNILQEVKTARRDKVKSAGVIDEQCGLQNIAGHFKEIYSEIYNRHNDRTELDEFIQTNNESIKLSDIAEIDAITPEMVTKTISKFKPDKNDSNASWKSNALKLGADSLAQPLCDILKSLVVHGHIPDIFWHVNSFLL